MYTVRVMGFLFIVKVSSLIMADTTEEVTSLIMADTVVEGQFFFGKSFRGYVVFHFFSFWPHFQKEFVPQLNSFANILRDTQVMACTLRCLGPLL